jgi:hypothetical protein
MRVGVVLVLRFISTTPFGFSYRREALDADALQKINPNFSKSKKAGFLRKTACEPFQQALKKTASLRKPGKRLNKNRRPKGVVLGRRGNSAYCSATEEPIDVAQQRQTATSEDYYAYRTLSNPPCSGCEYTPQPPVAHTLRVASASKISEKQQFYRRTFS